MGRERTQTNIWHVAVISSEGKRRESDGEVANWDKWSRNIFLTRWQLNRAKRGAGAKRTPVGRDTKATWVAGLRLERIWCVGATSVSEVQGVQERQVEHEARLRLSETGAIGGC